MKICLSPDAEERQWRLLYRLLSNGKDGDLGA